MSGSRRFIDSDTDTPSLGWRTGEFVVPLTSQSYKKTSPTTTTGELPEMGERSVD